MPKVPRVNDEMPDMTGINMSKLFDDRVAMSDDYRFDGVKGGDAWLKKIRGYFVSKCHGIKPILEFAEQHGHEKFTNDALAAEASTYRWMTETDVRRLSDVLWGFPHTCLKEKGEE